MKSPIRVAVTGAAGQIGYALLFRIASGSVFGPDQPVILHMIEIPPAMPALEGVVMELQDCAFPLLQGMVPTTDLDEGFKDVNWALLVGSVPGRPAWSARISSASMARSSPVRARPSPATPPRMCASSSSAIPATQTASSPCRTLRSIPADRWFAMTKLDENRAKTQLAMKAGVPVSDVKKLAIWGNHSSTMYPNFINAKIGGKPVPEVITDEAWFTGEFIPTVQQRGAAIIKARGASSAASAANAAIDTVMALTNPTAEGDFFSVAVCSDGSYGVEKGLIYSFPIRSDGQKLGSRPGSAHRRIQPVQDHGDRGRTEGREGHGGRPASLNARLDFRSLIKGASHQWGAPFSWPPTGSWCNGIEISRFS